MNIFAKDIERNINGVIKVGQFSDATITEELSEYIVTHELRSYFDAFYRRYVDALTTPTDKVGVWISGFFGSGKSHFLKILSYLLDNKEASGKKALAYFEGAVKDPLLYAAMQRAGEVSKDVILFNIDSKADVTSKARKEGIVEVFMKVFNEHRGYFGTAPEVADFERRLDKDGSYAAFKAAYEKASGKAWEQDRENWDFREDEVVAALQGGLCLSEEAARGAFERIGESYHISVEGFARTVRAYLEGKPKGHQVVFMVDEVGQYVGENSDLMLNLQTVVEDLGTFCEGRVWVMVTSQEGIDIITEDRVKGNDFSKIQGRFATRLNLSSANTDEVIKLRLLEKTADAADALRALYATKEQVLKNQIRFSSGTADMPGFGSAEEFVKSYPFVPYQFKLLQSVFTQVRLHGASGKHLSQGERSMLNAFQLAAQRAKDGELGTLVPFGAFYPAVERFLDAPIKLVITQAAANSRLEHPFDEQLLSVLFMIKYVKEIKGTAENLTSLALSHIDEDRPALQKRVEGALGRLERETLVQRSGDAFEFLTNEEQDVGREIKNFTINPGEVRNELQKIVWEELFTVKKYRLDARHDYPFNRKLDEQTYGSQTDDMTLHIVTPEGDTYREYIDDANALLRSGSNVVLVRLPDDLTPFEELRLYVKTDRYVKQKHSEGLSSSVRTILQTRADENRERRARVVTATGQLITQAAVFVRGAKVPATGSSARDVLTAGLKELVETTYTKLQYVKRTYETSDIEGMLREGAGAVQPDMDGEMPNSLAQSEMLHWLTERRGRHETVTLRALEAHFSVTPYGWARRDVQGVLAELLLQGKVELRHAQGTVNLNEPDLVQKMGLKSGLDTYTVRVPRGVNPEALRLARELAQKCLSKPVPASEPQALYAEYESVLEKRAADTDRYLTIAREGNYPFQSTLAAHQTLLKKLRQPREAAAFFETLRELAEDFEDFAIQSEPIESFFGGQRDAFDRARARLRALEPELPYLRDDELTAKVERAGAILKKDDPTKDIPELALLLSPVETHLNELREKRRQEALHAWGRACNDVSAYAKEQGAEDVSPFMQPLTALKDEIAAAPSIDAVLARKNYIEEARKGVRERIIEHLNAQARESATPVKTIVTFRPATHTSKSVLDSEADVETYVQRLRTALLDELSAGHRVSIE